MGGTRTIFIERIIELNDTVIGYVLRYQSIESIDSPTYFYVDPTIYFCHSS